MAGKELIEETGISDEIHNKYNIDYRFFRDCLSSILKTNRAEI